jgi:hypothetical protein
MSAVADIGTVTIDLESGCGLDGCADLAARFKEQLDTPKYARGVSVMPTPATFEDWRAAHRTARKRADRAVRLGYWFDEIDRSRFGEDIFEINTSLPVRQGRPMSDGYTRRRDHGPLPVYPCRRHRVRTYGVLSDEPKLVAYLTLYRVGELALVSMILGHGDHLRNDVMYMLAAGMISDQSGQGGFLYYNRHDSGTEGLRYYKERIGFASAEVSWKL